MIRRIANAGMWFSLGNLFQILGRDVHTQQLSVWWTVGFYCVGIPIGVALTVWRRPGD